MNRTQRNILIITSGLLAIGLMVLFIIFSGKKEKKPETGGTDNLPGAILPVTPRVSNGSNLPPEVREKMKEEASRELEVTRLAQLFLERYASFSNQGDYENISDLYPLMTSNMRRVASTYEEEQKRIHPAEGAYFGVTTKAMSSEIISITGIKATVKVNTQRQESSGSSAGSVVVYQKVSLSLVRLGDTWKVDDVDFEEVK